MRDYLRSLARYVLTALAILIFVTGLFTLIGIVFFGYDVVKR